MVYSSQRSCSFAAFFGALYYAREFSIPWLSGEGNGGHNGTHEFLWPAFQAAWPMNVMPDPSRYTEYTNVIPAFGVPALNTTLLCIKWRNGHISALGVTKK